MALPVAGIVCIVLACWVVLVLALFCLYRFLKHRGSCDCDCTPCGTAGGESCTCCKAISDSCNCCNPSLNGCLNSVCPKKKISCVDIILCQCCAEPGQDSCLVNIFPCCSRECECCEDGCCTCCADCDAVVCCCLEIRLISKSVPDESMSHVAAKYTPNYSKTEIYTNKSNQKKSGIENPAATKPAKTAKSVNHESISEKISGIRSTENTPRVPSSARSLSQLKFENSSSITRKHKTGKPATKMKPSSQTSGQSGTISNTASIRSMPAPPSLPPKLKGSEKSNLTSGIRKRASSEPSASELKEVPVEQQGVLLHSHLYESTYSTASGSFHGGPDLVLGLPSLYGAASHPVLLDSSSINKYIHSSLPQMTPGTILDGSGTHRSSVAGSTFSVDTNSLVSPRPLPGLPGR